MKTTFLASILMVVFLTLLHQLEVHAQSRAECVPKSGYWVLIGNVKIKKTATVQFFTDEHQLIYEEVVRNHKMDLRRLKTVRCLKRGLDSALTAWNQQKQPIFNKGWVAVNLRH
jgi:hypothetical protein